MNSAEHPREALWGDAFYVTYRLEKVDGKAQVEASSRDLTWPQWGGDQVVVEDFDSVELRGGDRGQLLLQGAASRRRWRWSFA